MKKKINFTNILMTLFGAMLTGFAVSVFLTPYKIVGGGVSGIATILFHVANIPTALSFLIINICLIAAGLKTLGKTFIYKTLAGACALSFFVELFSHFSLKVDSLILVAVFGGALYGIGIGISFASGATTGGTDILGRIIQNKYPYMPIGKVLMIIDGIIISISVVFFRNIELAMYGIITLFVSSNSIDFIISKLNVSKIVFVVTDKGYEISQKLVSSSPRGVTMMNVEGAYTNTKKQMLFCALKEKEMDKFERIILEIDKNAFIVFSQSQKINGNGFSLYK